MNSLLLDTCVWLDYHIPDRVGHEAAYKLVDAAARLRYPLLIASHSLKDFWYIFWQTGKLRNKESGELDAETASLVAKTAAWAAAEHIVEHATVVGSDASDAWIALKMRNTHFDYEDNLVIAAALRANPRFLVTSDQSLIAHSPIATVSPEDALEFLEII